MKTTNSTARWILICTSLLIVLLLCACTPSEQATNPETDTAGISESATGDPLEGVWRLQSVTRTATDGSEVSEKYVDGLLMFMNGYRSMVLIRSDEPRMPFADRFNATDEEKLAAFDTNTANAGNYEVSNGTLTVHPLAAKNPGLVGGRREYDFRIEGNLLHLTLRAVYMSSGDQSYPNTNWQRVVFTFVRVK